MRWSGKILFISFTSRCMPRRLRVNAKTVAIVVDFKPPPVPEGDAPMYMVTMSTITASGAKQQVSTVLNPAVVIAETAWNSEASTRCLVSRQQIDGSKK